MRPTACSSQLTRRRSSAASSSGVRWASNILQAMQGRWFRTALGSSFLTTSSLHLHAREQGIDRSSLACLVPSGHSHGRPAMGYEEQMRKFPHRGAPL